ncbi:hypothetical protein ACWEQU_33045 [Streptomyces nodosus]
MLSVTGFAASGPVIIFMSDPEDLTALCASRATVANAEIRDHSLTRPRIG